jgi:hypothetical protein
MSERSTGLFDMAATKYSRSFASKALALGDIDYFLLLEPLICLSSTENALIERGKGIRSSSPIRLSMPLDFRPPSHAGVNMADNF